MKKVLLAVDSTKGALRAAETFMSLFRCVKPEAVILLHVQKIEGYSLMDDALLSVGEMETLKEALEGTEYKEKLDLKSRKVIEYFEKILSDGGITGIKPLIREGHPAEEILETAKEEEADLIVMGSRGARAHNFFMGSVSREVVNRAEIPVLIAR